MRTWALKEVGTFAQDAFVGKWQRRDGTPGVSGPGVCGRGCHCGARSYATSGSNALSPESTHPWPWKRRRTLTHTETWTYTPSTQITQTRTH